MQEEECPAYGPELTFPMTISPSVIGTKRHFIGSCIIWGDVCKFWGGANTPRLFLGKWIIYFNKI